MKAKLILGFKAEVTHGRDYETFKRIDERISIGVVFEQAVCPTGSLADGDL
jgi:hypothetical protein